MARQNVGNPKFYIDIPSLWWAKGNIVGIGTSENNSFGESDYKPNLIGLNPSDYIDETLVYNHDRKFRIKVNHGVYLPPEADDNYFIGFLGHNLEDMGIKFKSIIFYSPGGTLIHEVPSIDEICNWETGDGFAYNGWSLGQFSNISSGKIGEIVITLENDTLDEIRTILGSLAFGYVYQMPHSPDLKLTMTRDYKGVTEQTTRGGGTLTQVNYSSPPDWAGIPAWELYTSTIGTYIDDNFKDFRVAGRGRRVWDLKFSYVGSDDLFAVNENLMQSNPTDSSTNPDAGYDSGDFYPSSNEHQPGQFKKFFGRDSSFVSMMMFSTIGGALPFIFQPDGNNNSPDQFAICKFDQDSFQFKQVANNVYDISLNIKEVW